MEIGIVNIITIVGAIVGIVSSYFKIVSIQRKEADDREKEIREYVDREISHLKETSVSEIKMLEQKIDSLRDDLKEHQKHIISLLSKK